MNHDLRHSYPNELYHHGIKGQKWGVRRFQNSDGTLTDAGKKRYGSTRLNFVQKAAGLEVNHSGMSKEGWIKESRELQQQMAKEWDGTIIDSNTGLALQKNTKTLKENVARVNPFYGELKYSNNPKSAAMAMENCVSCAVANELRRRNYEVIAIPAINLSVKESYMKAFKNTTQDNPYKTPPWKTMDEMKSMSRKQLRNNAKELDKFFKEAEKDRSMGNKELLSSIQKYVKEQPTGARGAMNLQWNRYSGHAMGYEILKNGKLRMIDAQTGDITDDQETIYRIFSKSLDVSFTRFDNLEVNKEGVREVVLSP